MGITIETHHNPNGFPIAHTCYNTIEIPEYTSKD
jgi:hypothetical protein